MNAKLNSDGSISICSETIAEDIVLRGMMNNEAYISDSERGDGGIGNAKLEISFRVKKKQIPPTRLCP